MSISRSKLNRLRALENETQKKTTKAGKLFKMYNFAKSVTELDDMINKVTKEKRKEISDAAAPIALKVYKSFVPRSNKPHKFYSRGMDRGSGPKYNIEPGNLRRSIQNISDKKSWKALLTSVGPLYKDAGIDVKLSSEDKTDGFYAHMVFGSTKAWISKVRNKAEKGSQNAVINKMSSMALKYMKEFPRQFWEL
jgi:hypothetical protein